MRDSGASKTQARFRPVIVDYNFSLWCLIHIYLLQAAKVSQYLLLLESPDNRADRDAVKNHILKSLSNISETYREEHVSVAEILYCSLLTNSKSKNQTIIRIFLI